MIRLNFLKFLVKLNQRSTNGAVALQEEIIFRGMTKMVNSHMDKTNHIMVEDVTVAAVSIQIKRALHLLTNLKRVKQNANHTWLIQ